MTKSWLVNPGVVKTVFYIDDRAVRPSEFANLSLKEIKELINREKEMFLIMSAAYVGQDLQSEFGKIPPSFLPLGNKTLISTPG